MAETIYSNKANVKSYSGASNAYTFYLEVLLNSQDDVTGKSNITINQYAHGNNGFNYSLFSSPTSYLKLYDSKSGETNIVKETVVDAIPEDKKTKIATWTGNVEHDTDGTLKIKVTAEYKPVTTKYTYLPAANSLPTTMLELPSLHTAPTIEGVTFTEKNLELKAFGVADDVIVPYLSNKGVSIDATIYDDAGVKEYQVVNGLDVYSSETTPVSVPLINGLSYSNNTATFTINVIDNKNAMSTLNIAKSVIPYTIPNFIITGSNVKRNGQTTGKVRLNLKATFYNQAIGSKQNNITLKFAYGKLNEVVSNTYYAIPEDVYVIDGNNITINNWNVAIDGQEITDVQKDSAYAFVIQATDAFGKTATMQLICTSGEYLMAKFKDRVDFKNITKGNKELWEIMYPVGSIITTGYDSVAQARIDPKDLYGGEWELIDKEFTPADIGDVMQMNSTNTTQSEAYGKRAGHTISFNANFVNKVAFNDTQRELGTLNLAKMGVTRLSDVFRTVGFSDGGNSEIFLLLANTGVLSTVDIGGNITSVAKDNTFFWSMTITWSNIDQMLDEACSKFYWKRTA